MTPIAVIIEAFESLRERLKDGLQPLDVLLVMKPLLLEFAMSDAILSPEQVDRLQERVHQTARNANLLKKVDL